MTDINKTTAGDVLHAVAKGAIGAVPMIGSLATEIFAMVVTPPLEKRRAEWMNEVAERLQALEDKGEINLNSLKYDDQFIDVVLQTTSFALKTSEKEKIDAFKNAVLNTALNDAPSITVSQIFLNQIDRFTALHIQILSLMNDPQEWFRKANKPVPTFYTTSSIFAVIGTAFPEIRNDVDLVKLIWEDLRLAGLQTTNGVSTNMSAEGALEPRTSQLGREFIAYIS
jgi:hypothetical protein